MLTFFFLSPSTPPHLDSFFLLQSASSLQEHYSVHLLVGMLVGSKGDQEANSVSGNNRSSYFQKPLELPYHDPVLTPGTPVTSSSMYP